MMDQLKDEIQYRATLGQTPTTIVEIERKLQMFGYKLDRSMDCSSVTTYMAGARAGCSYPSVSAYIVQSDDGVSMYNTHARRGAKFEAVQSLRRKGNLFAITKKGILEI